jgi:hypothetical protein
LLFSQVIQAAAINAKRKPSSSEPLLIALLLSKGKENDGLVNKANFKAPVN